MTKSQRSGVNALYATRFGSYTPSTKFGSRNGEDRELPTFGRDAEMLEAKDQSVGFPLPRGYDAPWLPQRGSAMKRRNLLVIGLLSAAAEGALALGSVTGANVTVVDTRPDGSFLVSFSVPVANRPACSNDVTRMSGNTNTAGGRSVLANAMLAFSANSRVSVQGTGTCAEYAGIESMQIFVQTR